MQRAAVVRDLPQGTGRREVEHVAFALEDRGLVGMQAVRVVDCPRRLYAERRLEIRLRALEVAQHEDAGPWLDCHTGGQLAA